MGQGFRLGERFLKVEYNDDNSYDDNTDGEVANVIEENFTKIAFYRKKVERLTTIEKSSGLPYPQNF